MLSIYDVKNYIKADDDDESIRPLMDAAESYLQGAIDNYKAVYAKAGKDWQAKADLAKKLLIADWYENRTPTERPVTSAVSLLITQLQLEGTKDEDSENS